MTNNSPADVALSKFRGLTADSPLVECLAAKRAIGQAFDARVRASVRVYGVTAGVAMTDYLETDEGCALREAGELVAAEVDFHERAAGHDQHVSELAHVW